MLIKWEESEVHGTEAGQRDADAVEHVPVRVDPDVEVGGEDVVEVADLLVPEECVGHPDLARVRQGEIFNFFLKYKIVYFLKA